MSGAGPKRLPIASAIGRLIVAALPLVLAACASSPRKSGSQALALPERGHVHSAGLPSSSHGGRKKSPYAPGAPGSSSGGSRFTSMFGLTTVLNARGICALIQSRRSLINAMISARPGSPSANL